MQYVSRAKLVELIKASGGEIIGVDFIKRSDGNLRKMNCRLGVAKYVKGTGRSMPDSAKLITVYDLQVARSHPESAYRSIPQEGLVSARIGGEVYQVQE
jgi:hypothetical protein